MAPQDVERLKHVFSRCDTSGDGMVSRTELRRILQLVTKSALSEAELDVVVKAADKSGDGRISADEFLDWVCTAGGGQDETGRTFSSGVFGLMDKPEPAFSSTSFAPIHVLLVEGSCHPGRLLGDEQFMGLPLHFDLLEAAFHRLPQASVRTVVSPPKSEVLALLREFSASVPDGALSVLLFTGHGVQATDGEQFLVFESRGATRTVSVQPMADENGEPMRPRQFRLRERMQHVDGQLSEALGPGWVAAGWAISAVDGKFAAEGRGNHEVVQAASTNLPFEVTLGRGQKTVDFLSYDEMRDIFACTGPSLHLIDACRVMRDDALGFVPEDRGDAVGDVDAEGARALQLSRRPCPPNVVSVFAARPGVQAMHEGAGRNYDRSRMALGHECEAEGILESDYARSIKEAWRLANENEGTILQYHTSFFVEALVDCLGELHMEGDTATAGDLLKRMTCCPFGRIRNMRGFRTFVGDNPVLEAGVEGVSGIVDSFAIQFQGRPFVTPEVEDE